MSTNLLIDAVGAPLLVIVRTLMSEEKLIVLAKVQIQTKSPKLCRMERYMYSTAHELRKKIDIITSRFGLAVLYMCSTYWQTELLHRARGKAKVIPAVQHVTLSF